MDIGIDSSLHVAASDKDFYRRHGPRRWCASQGLACGRGGRDAFFEQEIYTMLSKRFFAWVGVGVLSVATIPTLAAPQLARLAARKPAPVSKAVVTKSTLKATPTKAAAAAKTTAVAHKAAALPVKKTGVKTTTKTAGRLHAIHRAHAANKTIPAAHKPTTLVHKSNAVATHKPLAALAHKPTASSTAKKLLH
jgi:hypothetical protein